MRLATSERDFDYAHAMFAECVAQDPGNLKFVEAMVQNLRARSPKSKKTLFKIHRGGSRPFKKALHGKDWKAAIRAGIELLKADPWNVDTLQSMADACAALHYNEVELVYLKQALDAEPKNVEVNRHCASSLGRMGQYDQAIACWHRVETLKGKDQEAAKMISTLAADRLKYPGGHPPGMQAKPAPVEVPREETPLNIDLTPQQKLEQAISVNPRNVSGDMKLSRFLVKTNQLNPAETALSRSAATCGEQKELQDQLQQVRASLAEQERQLAENRAAERRLKDVPLSVPWLELALMSSLILLILQLYPPAGAVAWRLVDMTQWSRSGWFIFNMILLFGLFAVRFGPDPREVLQRIRIRATSGWRRAAGKSVKR
jgi:tetratricopeptide (TPR) repeat protein